MQISQSDVVRVRHARWQVRDIRAYHRCHLLTLVGVSASNAGLERRVLSPFDDVERIERRERPRRVSMRAWRRACRALLAGNTPPDGLRSALRARIDLLPHQLEPALAVVSGAGCRLLLADEVGLGKTVQAGLVVAELRARNAADRVLVITPAGLRDQWAEELAHRFGLTLVVSDVRSLRQMAATLPAGANPWQAMPLAIVSVDYVKRSDALADIAACAWDLVIVDEAHSATRDSERHAAVAVLTARAPYVVLVTATPHNGDRDAFHSLCGLGSMPNDRLLVFRRARRDVGFAGARRVHRLLVRLSPAELRMHRCLDRFISAVRRAHVGNAGHPAPGLALALSVLEKRAWSSARSLQRSVERRLDSLTLDSPPDGQLLLPLVDTHGELTSEDDAPEWSPLLALGDARRERRLLEAVRDTAAEASRGESKFAALRRLRRRIREPMVVFTEYRDTLLHLQRSLDEPSAILHGGLSRDERRRVVEQFASGAIRLLLATDAASEGLNLHHSCRVVVNLELPWNPMRLEQRIGRVDRIGQRRTVHVFYLIARGTGERQMLARLQFRIARASADVGSPDPLGIGSDAPAAPSSPLNSITVESAFVEQGIAEAIRVTTARTLLRPGDRQVLDALESGGPSLAVARRSATRVALGSRDVMLWSVAIADQSRRTVMSTLVALMTDRTVCGQPHDPDNDPVIACVRSAAAVWQTRALDAHRRLIATRLAREHGLAAHHSTPSLFQPGLFDRRIERARLAAASADQETLDDRALRIASLEHALDVTPVAPRLLLILSAR